MDYVLGVNLASSTLRAATRRRGSAESRRLPLGRRAISSLTAGAPAAADADACADLALQVVAEAVRAMRSRPARVVIAYPSQWDAARVALAVTSLERAGLPPTAVIAAPPASADVSAEEIADDAAAAALEELDELEGLTGSAVVTTPIPRAWPRVAAVTALSLLLAAAPAAVIGPGTVVLVPSEQGHPGTGPTLLPTGEPAVPELTTLPLPGDPARPTSGGPASGTPGASDPTVPPLVVVPDPVPDPTPDPEPTPDPDPTLDPVPDPTVEPRE